MSEDSRLRDQKGQSTKRFYKEVTTVPQDDGVAVLLDGKLIRTPAKAMLAVPSQALAAAIAAMIAPLFVIEVSFERHILPEIPPFAPSKAWPPCAWSTRGG